MSENAFEKTRVESGLAGHVRNSAATPPDPGVAHQGARLASADQVETLFALARRHDLPFSVVVVRPLGSTPIPPALDLVESETRQTDLLAQWDGLRGIAIFCPATPAAGVLNLVQRLRRRANGVAIGIGSASFRDDGFTLDDLVECAAQRERASHPDRGDDEGTPRIGSRPRIGPVRTRWPSAPVSKRVFDVVTVVATAPLWLPLVALVALIVKLADPRAPVLFVQQRTGFRGRRFDFYKFRTMVRDAEQLKPRLQQLNERSWPDFKIEADPRITWVGGWLRTTSLDELPQLWNVLRGDMSLVGPRPTSFPAQTYEAWQTARLDAIPGLTGLWQVESRNGDDFDERIRLDLRYVESRSFATDLRILLRTVPAVIWRREGR